MRGIVIDGPSVCSSVCMSICLSSTLCERDNSSPNAQTLIKFAGYMHLLVETTSIKNGLRNLFRNEVESEGVVAVLYFLTLYLNQVCCIHQTRFVAFLSVSSCVTS